MLHDADLTISRMFSSSLSEEARQIEEEIEAVKAKVDDPVICEKVRRFVYAPKEIQDIHRQDAGKTLPLSNHRR